MKSNHAINRRQFLRIGGVTGATALAAACAPAAGPSPPPAPPPSSAQPAPPQKAAWETEWEQFQAAAKKEGKLSVLTLAGVGYRKTMDDFQERLGLPVEHEGAASGSVWAPKVESERKAGIYSYDVLIVPPNTALARFKPQGAWDPIRPILFRPDVTGDSVWRESFDNQFMDTEKQLAFGWEYTVYHNVAIDTNQVRPDEIKSFQDLLDPKWKGRMLLTDARLGPTYIGMTAIRERFQNGDELVKRFLVDQQPTFTRESRQLAEAVVRGRNPVVYGLTPANLETFVQQGVANHVKYLDLPEVDTIYNWSVFLYNRAPHPNAAKLFINWLLSKEGQTVIGKNIPTNSARTDVETFDKVGAATPGVKYFSSGRESTYQKQADTQKFINALVGITN